MILLFFLQSLCSAQVIRFGRVWYYTVASGSGAGCSVAGHLPVFDERDQVCRESCLCYSYITIHSPHRSVLFPYKYYRPLIINTLKAREGPFLQGREDLYSWKIYFLWEDLFLSKFFEYVHHPPLYKAFFLHSMRAGGHLDLLLSFRLSICLKFLIL